MRGAPTAREVWERTIRCHWNFDIEGFAAMFAEDGVMEVPFPVPGVPSRLEGRAEILRVLTPLWRRSQASGRRPLGTDRVVVHEGRDPESAVIEFDVMGEDAAKRPYRLAYVHVVRVRDGYITHLRDYVDSWAIGQRLQALRPE